MAIEFGRLLAEEKLRVRAELLGSRTSRDRIDGPALLHDVRVLSPHPALPLTSHLGLNSGSHRPSPIALAHLPRSVMYAAEWCTPEEEASLIAAIDAIPTEVWAKLRHRRCVNMGGMPAPEGMRAEIMPAWVGSVCSALTLAGAFSAESPANHVLLNEYGAGEYIDAHRDGPMYEPIVAILSLASECTFEFVAAEPERRRESGGSLRLAPRSLLLFSEDAYASWLHHVQPVAERRLSLTVRRVLSVMPVEPPR